MREEVESARLEQLRIDRWNARLAWQERDRKSPQMSDQGLGLTSKELSAEQWSGFSPLERRYWNYEGYEYGDEISNIGIDKTSFSYRWARMSTAELEHWKKEGCTPGTAIDSCSDSFYKWLFFSDEMRAHLIKRGFRIGDEVSGQLILDLGRWFAFSDKMIKNLAEQGYKFGDELPFQFSEEWRWVALSSRQREYLKSAGYKKGDSFPDAGDISYFRVDVGPFPSD